MEILFESDSYDRLETDRRFFNGFAPAVVAIYRRRLQLLRALHRIRSTAKSKSGPRYARHNTQHRGIVLTTVRTLVTAIFQRCSTVESAHISLSR